MSADRQYRSIDGTMNDSWHVDFSQSGTADPTVSGNRTFISGPYSANGVFSAVGSTVNSASFGLGYTSMTTSLSGSYMKMGMGETLSGNVSSTFSDFAVLGSFQKNSGGPAMPGGLAARGGIAYFRDNNNWVAGSFGYVDPTDPALPTQTFGAMEFSLRSDAIVPSYWTGAVTYRNGAYSGQLPDLTLFPPSKTAAQLRTTLDFIDSSVGASIIFNINY